MALPERRKAKGRFAESERGEPWTEADLHPGRHFDLSDLWADIDEVRKTKAFKDMAKGCKDPSKDPAVHPAAEVVSPGPEEDQAWKAAERFRITMPEARDPWDAIEPFLEGLEDALNDIKPKRLPGYLEFGFTDEGAFGLFYVECTGAKP